MWLCKLVIGFGKENNMQKYRRQLNKLMLAIVVSFSFAMLFSVVSMILAFTRGDLNFIFGQLTALNSLICFIVGFIYVFRLNQHTI